MNDKPSIRDVTTELEKGDGHSLPVLFQGKFEEERFKDLDAIRTLNEADLKAGRTNTTLDVSHIFHYNDLTMVRSENGAWDAFKGGKILYDDTLTMRPLQHSNAADQVPALRHPVNIDKLTAAAERGNGPAIETALSGKFQEERAAILTDVEQHNQRDLANGQTKATLEISLAGAKGSGGDMTIARVLPTVHDYWMGGEQIYSERLDAATGNREISASIDRRKEP